MKNTQQRLNRMVYVRLSEEEYQQLKEVAADSKRPISYQVRYFLKEALDEQK